MSTHRKIIHIDMDCFYAAIEMRENPSLTGKPVAVGGQPNQRGVLTTCNYVARKYGLHSAMSSAQALKLCPHLTLIPANFPLYRQVSQQIHQIFQQYTHIIEPLSLDEAYLDVTECKQYSGSATWIAKAIRQQIFDTLQLTASAGIAPLKYLAKIASDKNKPNGQYVITPQQIPEFVRQLPLSLLPGVGKVTAEKLAKLGFSYCADIQKSSLHVLLAHFGKQGKRIWEFSHGIDDRVIKPKGTPKSIGVETTLLKDIENIAEAQAIVNKLYQKLDVRLTKHSDIKLTQHKLGIKLKFADFQVTTLEKTGLPFTLPNIYQLLESIWLRRNARKVRLIGLHIHLAENLSPQEQQIALW